MPHRTVIAILALVVLGLGADSARAQENLPQLIKKIQPAVVTVIGYNANGKVVRVGSGFFINNHGQVITAGHVIYWGGSSRDKNRGWGTLSAQGDGGGRSCSRPRETCG